jgi:cytochrome c oxidase cbb3-type subunit 3
VSKRTERDQILGHEDEADGIQEYDNPMPDWWLGLFWLCIIFAVGYTVHYHFIADRSPEKALARELASAEVRYSPGDDAVGGSTTMLDDEAAEAGEAVFGANCASCHGAELQGGIGPNLVDDEWVHGSSVEAIRNTITNGIVEKGMLAWGPILGAERIGQVTAYVVQQHAEAQGLPFPPGGGDHDEMEGAGDEGDEHSDGDDDGEEADG